MIELGDLVAAAHRLQTRWTEQGLRFCFIGGLAVQRWGEPRYTRDIDATLFVGFGGERQAIEGQLQQLRPRISNAAEFAVVNRVLLVEDANGYPIDISLAAMPFEEDLIARSTLEQLCQEQEPIRTCSPSDLVILKVFAGRPQDWQDVRGVLVRSGHRLDWQLVETELQVLLDLKEEPGSLAQLRELRDTLRH